MKEGDEMIKPFDYNEVMEIAARLLVLGIPIKTIEKIRKWANEERAKRKMWPRA